MSGGHSFLSFGLNQEREGHEGQERKKWESSEYGKGKSQDGVCVINVAIDQCTLEQSRGKLDKKSSNSSKQE